MKKQTQELQGTITRPAMKKQTQELQSTTTQALKKQTHELQGTITRQAMKKQTQDLQGTTTRQAIKKQTPELCSTTTRQAMKKQTPELTATLISPFLAQSFGAGQALGGTPSQGVGDLDGVDLDHAVQANHAGLGLLAARSRHRLHALFILFPNFFFLSVIGQRLEGPAQSQWPIGMHIVTAST